MIVNLVDFMDIERLVKENIVLQQNHNIEFMRNQYKKEIKIYENDIKTLSDNVKSKEEGLKLRKEFLEARHKKFKMQDFSNILNEIRNNRDIKSVSLDVRNIQNMMSNNRTDFIVNIKTKPIMLKDGDSINDIGGFLIRVCFFKEHGKFYEFVRIENEIVERMEKVYNYGFQQHPHISSDGEMCSGNIQNAITHHLEKVELDKLVLLIVEFLKTYSSNSAYILYLNYVNAINFFKRAIKDRKIGRYNIESFKDIVFGSLRDNFFSLLRTEKETIDYFRNEIEKTLKQTKPLREYRYGRQYEEMPQE